MFATRFFRTSPAESAGKALFSACVDQARTPGFYGQRGAPDSTAGRFELYTLHVALLVLSLKGRGDLARQVSQHLFDAYVENIDIALRELGVGDPSMGKKMRKVGEMFYGRAHALEAAMGDRPALEGLLGRTVHAGREGAATPELADYVARAGAGLSAQPDERLLLGAVEWPEAPS